MSLSLSTEGCGCFDAAARPGLLSGIPMSYRISMRRLVLLSIIMLVCAAGGMLSGAMQAQKAHKPHYPKRMEKEQIEQLESQWQQAMLNDDVPAMDKLLADDYLGVTAGGDLVTKSQQLDRMRTRQVMVTKLDTSEIKFKLIGPIAIVTSLAQIEAVSDGKTITGAYRSTRVYQRLQGGVWKITSFETTRIPPGHRPNPSQ